MVRIDAISAHDRKVTHASGPFGLLSPDEYALLGRDIGGWSLLRCIGKGGMSIVFEGVKSGQVAAIKVLQEKFRRETSCVERFRREGQAIAQLQHTNIVRLFEQGDDPTCGHYIALEYLKGVDLEELLLTQHKLPLSWLLPVMEQICSALKYMHGLGLVHRDLKPGNIFLVPEEPFPKVKLLDFGIVKDHEQRVNLTEAGMVMGTPAYLAPEQVKEHGEMTPATDLYSFGVVLFEALTGEHPLGTADHADMFVKILHQEPTKIGFFRPEFHETPLEEILFQLLRKNPRERYGSVSLFWNEFDMLCQWIDDPYDRPEHIPLLRTIVSQKFAQTAARGPDVESSMQTSDAPLVTRAESGDAMNHADTVCPACRENNQLTRSGKVPPFCSICRFPLVLVAGKYKLVQALSEGGFGMVYLANHIHLDFDTERAVKVLKADIFKVESHMERRFRTEVQVTSALSQRNEHIVRIYDDFGLDESLGYYYIMEYLKGQTLDDISPVGTILDERITFKIFSELCKAMAAAHFEGIIHRDLKPENIFLEKRRNDPYFVKVLDFGISKLMGDDAKSKMTQGVMGTPAYMSPEQCRNREITPQSDIYSMGIILYELLAGAHPLGEVMADSNTDNVQKIMAHLTKKPNSLREWRDDISPAFDDALCKAIAKKPEERYQSVEDFWRELKRYAPREWGLLPLFEELVPVPEPAMHARGQAIAVTHVPSGESAKRPLPTPQPDDGEAKSATINITREYPARNWLMLIALASTALALLGAFVFFVWNPASPAQNGPGKGVVLQERGPDTVRAKASATPQRVSPRPRASVATPPPTKARSKGKSASPIRTTKPRTHIRTAKKKRTTRKLRVPTRATVRAVHVGPCGAETKTLRWIWSTLHKPKKGRLGISFIGCPNCRLKQLRTAYCMGIPRQYARVKVRVTLATFVSCKAWITKQHKRIGWSLKYEGIDAMADEAYRCIKEL